MKVVFLEDIADVASAGDVQDVASGYARNYLIPKGFATPATKQALERVEKLRKAAAQRQTQALAEAQELANRMEGLTVTFAVKVGEGGRLFGSVTAGNIAEEIEKVIGQEIDRRRIVLDQPLREIGTHSISLRLARDVMAQVTVNIESESGPEPEPEPESEPDTTPELDVVLESESDAEVEPGADPNPETESELDPETETE
jgi:large subunit ribosomal protein L9